MAQILALSLMISALIGLAFVLTRRRAMARWGVFGVTVAVWGLVLILAERVGVGASPMLSYLANFIIIASLYALLVLGLNIQWGYTGLFNIGVAGFFGVGAYVSTILVQDPKNLEVAPGLAGFFATYYNLPFPVGLVGAMAVSGVLAFIVGMTTLRLRTDYLAIATIGISEILRIIVTNERNLTEGTRGIPNIPQPLYECLVRQIGEKPPCQLLGVPIPQFLEPAYYNWFYVLIVIGVLVLSFLAVERIARSPWGRVLRAVREDEAATSSLGKNIFGFKLQALVVGAIIMGAAGSLWAHFVKFIDPQIFDPVTGTFLAWVMLIVGGTGNNRGALLGAFVIWGIWSATNFLNDILPPVLDTPLGKINVAAQLFGPIRIIAIAVMLELILLFRPRGILGEERQTSVMIEHL
jgi:branched-chain amino acid transport system permease protein